MALMLAREVGTAGRVFAVEANRHNADIAIRNSELNGASNIEITRAAIGSIH